MCNCQMMARDLSETQNGRLPASLHAPQCEDFKLLPFNRIRTDSGQFIVPADELEEVCKHVEEAYEVDQVMLTQDQYDNLPEFEG